MQGYKTIIFAAMSVLTGVATMLGVTLDAETVKELAANLEMVVGGVITVMGIATGIFRAVTKSPLFKKAD